MNKKLRQKVFDKYDGRCAYCGKKLTKMHVDHIKPVNRLNKKGLKEREKELTEIGNLNPSCPRCNNWKLSSTLEVFREQIGNLINGLNRDSPQYRMAKDYGLVDETEKPVKFYYETL